MKSQPFLQTPIIYIHTYMYIVKHTHISSYTVNAMHCSVLYICT